MRRSICYCEPPVVKAGDKYTLNFNYTSATKLPKGTKLKFDLLSEGRDIDWEIPTVNMKKSSNVIFLRTPNNKVVQGKEVEVSDRFTPQYEFTLPEKVDSGSTFSLVVGSSKNGEAVLKKNGTTVQRHSQRRRTFHLFIDTSGKGKYEDPEVFSIDIRGNALSFIRVITPSFVVRNKRFDVIVRFEDEYGNLTSNAPEDTLIELSHEHLRENLNWKLFVPETGFITLPNIYFNEPGFYTIQLRNTHTKELFRSPPIKCFLESDQHLFWGVTHGESDKIDSTENIESCLRHFRDEKAVNFFAISPFESVEETPNDIWKLISQNVIDFDEHDRFTTFLGCQWQGDAGSEGLRQIIFSKDNKQILRKKDLKYSSLSKIYKSATPKEFISIPCFTMGKGFEFNFKNFNPEFERVVEIYNSWGSSECLKVEGNHLPIDPGKNGVKETGDGSIVKALKNNYRFGFVAGGLDDRGVYAELYESDQVQYPPGLTAIMSKDQSRSSLFEALYNRSCYATTGDRIILGFYLTGEQMGSEISTEEKHGLHVNRHLTGFCAGTTNIQLVEIIRNGEVLKTFEPNEYNFEFAYDDMVPIKDVAIDAKDKNPPFIFYYLKVTQENGHMGWSSPIWVDLK